MKKGCMEFKKHLMIRLMITLNFISIEMKENIPNIQIELVYQEIICIEKITKTKCKQIIT